MPNKPTTTLTVKTTHHVEMIDVSHQIESFVRETGIRDGYVIVYVPHTTAAVTINENADPDVKHDVLKKLDELIPRHEDYYRHNEGNSDAHLKASLVGSSVTVLIEAGKLVLGQWQGIYFCEFDGPRVRKLNVKVVAG